MNKGMFKIIVTLVVCALVIGLATKVNNTKAKSNVDAESVYKQKIEADESTHTTALNTNVEETLNKAGIFDEDLSIFDEKEIKAFNQAEDIQVSVGYFQVNESTREFKEIKPYKLYEYNEKIWSKIKIMKQCLYVLRKGEDVTVFADTIWWQSTYYKKADAFTLFWDNFVSNDLYCKHQTNVYLDNEYQETRKTTPECWIIRGAGDGITHFVNLFGSHYENNRLRQEGKTVPSYYPEHIMIAATGEKWTTDNTMYFYTAYHHSKNNDHLFRADTNVFDGPSIGLEIETAK